MRKRMTRWVVITFLPALVAASGCSSCQQSPEVPAPVSKEGRLPRPPEAVATSVITPEIPPPACAVVASASAEEGPAPLEVKFSAEGMCTDATAKYTWDFGDGSEPSHDQNATHTYASAGTFTARVKIADPEHNAEDSDEIPIAVTAPQP